MNNQKGVSLVITFFIMTIMLAFVLSISTILFQETKIITGIGSSVFSFYAIDTGIEKTLYFDRKVIGANANRGFCNLCSSCNSPGIDTANYCNNCTLTVVDSSQSGCNLNSCKNCQVNYDSPFAGDIYSITATVSDSSVPNFDMDVTGFYKNVTRKVELTE